MKKIFFPIIIINVILFPSFFVSAIENQDASLDDILQEILNSQNVTKVTDIDCKGVSDIQFEELGDAVMGLMVGSEEQHEIMDQMMGGEGSESLKSTHILMGKQYLGCQGEGYGTSYGMMGIPGMMGGSGMMGMPWGNMTQGYGNSNYYGMMPGFSFGYRNMMNWGFGNGFFLNWISLILFWAVMILAIIALVKWIAKQKEKERK